MFHHANLIPFADPSTLTRKTSHLKFINALATSAAEINLPPSDELSARKFHADLFASGIERILAVSRLTL